MPHKTQKGVVVLADGRVVPDYVESSFLPIETYRPSKYAVVDMETGHVWVANKDDPSKVDSATVEDLKIVHSMSETSMFTDKVPYNDSFDADKQITMEERIASAVHDFQEGQIELDIANACEDHTLTHEDCQLLGQNLLYLVLREFRPDLFQAK